MPPCPPADSVRGSVDAGGTGVPEPTGARVPCYPGYTGVPRMPSRWCLPGGSKGAGALGMLEVPGVPGVPWMPGR